MSRAEEAAKAYKESLPKRGYVVSEACFLNGVKWCIEQAKKQKEDPDYKDGGYAIRETLVSLNRLESLIK